MKSSIVGEAINLGNDTEIDINTLAAIFMDVSGNKLKIEYGESIQNEPRERQPDLTKARKLLGYDYSIPVCEGLTSTLKYFKEKLN